MRTNTIFKIFMASLCVAAWLCTMPAIGQAEELKGKTVNVNTGTAEELAGIPLMTPELGKAIVKYRDDNGDFMVIEELLQVPGFSRDLLNKIKPFLILEGLGGEECTC